MRRQVRVDRSIRRIRRIRAIRRWNRKHPRPLCCACGYDLAELGEAPVCTECGRACEWDAPWWRDGRWPLWMAALPMLAPLLVVMSGIAWLAWCASALLSKPPTAPFPNALLTQIMIAGHAAPLSHLIAIPAQFCVDRMASARTRHFRHSRRRLLAAVLLAAAVATIALAIEGALVAPIFARLDEAAASP